MRDGTVTRAAGAGHIAGLSEGVAWWAASSGHWLIAVVLLANAALATIRIAGYQSSRSVSGTEPTWTLFERPPSPDA